MATISEDRIRAALDGGDKLAIPYFDGMPVLLLNEGVAESGPGKVTTDEATTALKAFLALSLENRHADGRHLIAYCKMMVDAVGEEVLEDMDNEIPSLDTVWNFVSPRSLGFGFLDPGAYAERRTIFVKLEADVPWEPEHGLMMSWADGDTLVKVSGYDGHPTNGHASADPSKDQYVFACYRANLSTTR